MALNIKDTETHELVRKLAKQTGESLTLAVKVAVKERLERQEQSSRSSGRMERIRKIVERTAPLMKDSRPSKELFDELYDEKTGLPK